MHRRLPFIKVSILLMLVLFQSCSKDDEPSPSERVFRGNVFLNTQEAMDRFASSGYTKIIGDLRIGTGITDEISNVNTIQLSSLISIDGVFTISQTALTSLSGIENLQEVSSQLLIIDNHELVNIDGLETLKNCDGITIRDNDMLENISGLRNTVFSSSLSIYDNLSLASITAFNGLTDLVGFITVRDNPSLTDLTGFNGLTNLTGDITISNNPVLVDLTGLSDLVSINGMLTLTNSGLSSISGLDKLEFISEGIIQENSNLRSLEGLEALDSIGSRLVIEENPLLNNFCALNALYNSSESLDKVVIDNNNYNPDADDFKDGDCSN